MRSSTGPNSTSPRPQRPWGDSDSWARSRPTRRWATRMNPCSAAVASTADSCCETHDQFVLSPIDHVDLRRELLQQGSELIVIVRRHVLHLGPESPDVFCGLLCRSSPGVSFLEDVLVQRIDQAPSRRKRLTVAGRGGLRQAAPGPPELAVVVR